MSCKCLKVFFYQVHVTNCLFSVQMSYVYSEEHNLAIVTILGWTICLSKRWNKMLECLKLIIHDCWSYGRIYSMCSNKSCIQMNSVGNPACSQKHIYHSCLHEFTYAEFTGHVTHRACMHVHTSFIHINKHCFSMIYRPELEDRFTPAWCLPVCDVFTHGA